MRVVGSMMGMLAMLVVGLASSWAALALSELDKPYAVVSVDLPNAEGHFGQTALVDVNAAEQLLGGFVAGPATFLLDSGFQVTPVACEGAAGETGGKALNTAGAVAGFCRQGTQEVGFIRDPDGTLTLLQFPGATLTEALGLNDARQVVGDYRDPQGTMQGFFYENGLFLPFHVPFPEAVSTSPSAINNHNQITGFFVDAAGHTHGFFYDNGVFRRLDIAGATDTLPLALSDNGQVVGLVLDETGAAVSFLLDVATGDARRIRLALPEATIVDVAGIGPSGQLVGRYLESPTQPGGDFFNHGFLAVPLGGPSIAPAAPGPAAHKADVAGDTLWLDTCSAPPTGTWIPMKLATRARLCPHGGGHDGSIRHHGAGSEKGKRGK